MNPLSRDSKTLQSNKDEGQAQDRSEYARTDPTKDAGEEDRRHQKEIERVIAKHWGQERAHGESSPTRPRDAP